MEEECPGTAVIRFPESITVFCLFAGGFLEDTNGGYWKLILR
jgi:hypothetical protein